MEIEQLRSGTTTCLTICSKLFFVSSSKEKTHPSLSLSLHSKTKIPGNPPALANRRDEYFQSWNRVLPRRGFVAPRWRVRVFPKGVFQSALTSVTVFNRRQLRRTQQIDSSTLIFFCCNVRAFGYSVHLCTFTFLVNVYKSTVSR